MDFKESIIIYCLEKLNGERTISSIYHLLKGKKSSQTIQDAHLFDLTRFFKIYETLSRETLIEIINNAAFNGWISECGEGKYRLTKLGEATLHAFFKKSPIPNYVNGWKYHSIAPVFWERLSLLVQVISNLVSNETHYIPIQKSKNTHQWLKMFIKNNKLNRNLISKALYDELVDSFNPINELNPSILVFRLTGNNIIGLTSLQLAEKMKIDVFQYHFEFQNILHYLIKIISTEPTRYPILSSLMDDTKSNISLTNSSKLTFELIQKGHSIENIAKIRQLRKNTIEDHVVEIALNIEGFSIRPFIDEETQKLILSAANKLSSKQLKVIRPHVESANYFEIRLVLAKYGANQWI